MINKLLRYSNNRLNLMPPPKPLVMHSGAWQLHLYYFAGRYRSLLHIILFNINLALLYVLWIITVPHDLFGCRYILAVFIILTIQRFTD